MDEHRDTYPKTLKRKFTNLTYKIKNWTKVVQSITPSELLNRIYACQRYFFVELYVTLIWREPLVNYV